MLVWECCVRLLKWNFSASLLAERVPEKEVFCSPFNQKPQIFQLSVNERTLKREIFLLWNTTIIPFLKKG